LASLSGDLAETSIACLPRAGQGIIILITPARIPREPAVPTDPVLDAASGGACHKCI
jgi:hypothetical protein